MTSSTELDALFRTASDLAAAEAGRTGDMVGDTGAADGDTGGEGEGVAAAALTRSGEVLVGVWVEAMVDSACLCAETGPICDAHRRRDPIRASVCVRWTPDSGATVLPACGVCQERLAVFGGGVLIAVALTDGVVEYATLADLRPHPWWSATGG